MGFTIHYGFHDGFHDGFHGDMLKNPRMMVPSVSYFGHTTSLKSLPFFGGDNCATPNGDITHVYVYNIYIIYVIYIYMYII